MDDGFKRPLRHRARKRKFSKHKRVVPKVPRCMQCKVGKVLHHHYYCDVCWEKKYLEEIKW